ncbi:MAG: energy-coupling factor ABC transporter permease [Pseudomonadota bacterium]|nr:energy-coupling factor ABC transporter permease [Pseudomonadota bacterium]
MLFSSQLTDVFALPLWAAACLGLVGLALWQAPWRAVLSVPARQHALLGGLVGVCLIWSFRFEVIPGLQFHPFLMTTVTLVFGWCFALIMGAFALLLLVLVGTVEWQTLPWNWLFSAVLPASMAYGLLRVIEWLPTRNLFVYILGLGFFGTLLTTLLNCLLLLGFFWWLLPDKMLLALWDKRAFVVPLLYSEGFINGMLVTSVTVFFPDLVKTFDEDRFLKSDS